MKSYLPLTNMQRPIMQSLVGIAACALVISGCASGTEQHSLTIPRAASTWKK